MRVIVIHGGALGDCVLALKALTFLREAYPSASITGYCRYPVWDYANLGIKTISLEHSGIHKLFVEPAPLVTGKAELVVTWMGWKDETFLENLRKSAQGKVISAPSTPPENELIHASDYLLKSLLEKIESPSFQKRVFNPLLSVKEDEMLIAEKKTTELGITDIKRTLVIHAGSGAKAKCWEAEKFAEIARRWRLTGRQALVIEGYADEEHTARMLKIVNLPVLKTPPISDLIYLLANCEAYLGNDSGISHLAGASGGRAVVLFGPTDPRVWAPMGENVRIVESSADCAPCPRSKWSNCTENKCMNTIEVEEVWQTLLCASKMRTGGCSPSNHN